MTTTTVNNDNKLLLSHEHEPTMQSASTACSAREILWNWHHSSQWHCVHITATVFTTLYV